MKKAQVKFLGSEANNQEPQVGLVGSGTLEIDGDGIHVVGKKGKKLIPVLVGSVLGLVCLIAVIILVDSLGVSASGRSGGKLAFLMGMLGGILPGYGIYALLLAKLPGVPIDARVAWDKLQVRRVTRGRITLHAAEPALNGEFALTGADPQSQAVLAEAFGVAQALPS